MLLLLLLLLCRHFTASYSPTPRPPSPIPTLSVADPSLFLVSYILLPLLYRSCTQKAHTDPKHPVPDPKERIRPTLRQLHRRGGSAHERCLKQEVLVDVHARVPLHLHRAVRPAPRHLRLFLLLPFSQGVASLW